MSFLSPTRFDDAVLQSLSSEELGALAFHELSHLPDEAMSGHATVFENEARAYAIETFILGLAAENASGTALAALRNRYDEIQKMPFVSESEYSSTLGALAALDREARGITLDTSAFKPNDPAFQFSVPVTGQSGAEKRAAAVTIMASILLDDPNSEAKDLKTQMEQRHNVPTAGTLGMFMADAWVKGRLR